MVDKEDVLFVGLGQSAVAWYRCYLPASAMDADHVGLHGDPPNVRWATGLVRVPGEEIKQSTIPNFADYKVVVLQQPKGRGWAEIIRALRDRGVRVIYEVDDYIHGIHKQQDHDFREGFGKKDLPEWELCMRMSDALVASTEYIARRYRKFNRRTFVCENAIDLKRYAVTRPERSTVNIGWSGATGHTLSMAPWLSAVARAMHRHDNVCFVSIGQDFATAVESAAPDGRFAGRTITVPFAAVEQYPAAMTLMDIALGPARHTQFYAGKSDLRWLEAGALGIPIIADPFVYGKIRDGYDGFHWAPQVDKGADAYMDELLDDLIDDEALRTDVGGNARRLVQEQRSFPTAVDQWREVFEEVVNG